MSALKTLSVAASILSCRSANALIQIEASVHIASFVLRDAGGQVLSLVFAPDLIYTNVQTSEILYGLDTSNGATNRTRYALQDLCTHALVVPGADMGASACASGPTGSWNAVAWSNAAPSSISASVVSQWTMVLQPGQSLSTTGTVAVHARSIGGNPPPTSPVGQGAHVEAHFIFIPQGSQTSFTQLTASAGPTNEDDGRSASFSYFTANTWSYPINVYAEVVVTPVGSNAVVAVPEPSTWLMWLFGFLALTARVRREKAMRVEL